MNADSVWRDRLLALLRWLLGIRYIKFGMVGASGTVVNIAVLYLGHEYVFQNIEGAQGKPYASLALAIAVATVNNFTWNRLWTWADRVQQAPDPTGTEPLVEITNFKYAVPYCSYSRTTSGQIASDHDSPEHGNLALTLNVMSLASGSV